MSTVRAAPAPTGVGESRPGDADEDDDEDEDAAASLLVIRVARAAVLVGMWMRLTTWGARETVDKTRDEERRHMSETCACKVSGMIQSIEQ